MTIENDILVFPDYDSYFDVFKELYQLNSDELIQWNESLGYKSLLTKDFNTKNSVEVIDDSEEELEEKGGLDDVRKTLYSDKGLLIIGDTLYKVIDDYIYKYRRIPKSLYLTWSLIRKNIRIFVLNILFVLMLYRLLQWHQQKILTMMMQCIRVMMSQDQFWSKCRVKEESM